MIGWGWVAAYTVLIYSTIPFARTWLNFLVEILGPRFSFWVNALMLLVGITCLVIFWLTHRLTPGQWAVLLITGLAVGIFVAEMEIPEERIHLLEYAGLGYLLFLTLHQRYKDALLYSRGISLALLIGIGDELIQGILPHRVFDIRDIFFNSLGGVAGFVMGGASASSIQDYRPSKDGTTGLGRFGSV